MVCDTSDGTVAINKNNWIGVYNNTLPALASFCPLDYCKGTINKLSLGRPWDLCSEGRTGIICGHCHSNYSVIFGSSQCQVCSDMWLSTLVMFAVLGRVPYWWQHCSSSTSLSHKAHSMNLDLGIPLCFYDGMDDADKAGLQFGSQPTSSSSP